MGGLGRAGRVSGHSYSKIKIKKQNLQGDAEGGVRGGMGKGWQRRTLRRGGVPWPPSRRAPRQRGASARPPGDAGGPTPCGAHPAGTPAAQGGGAAARLPSPAISLRFHSRPGAGFYQNDTFRGRGARGPSGSPGSWEGLPLRVGELPLAGGSPGEPPPPRRPTSSRAVRRRRTSPLLRDPPNPLRSWEPRRATGFGRSRSGRAEGSPQRARPAAPSAGGPRPTGMAPSRGQT